MKFNRYNKEGYPDPTPYEAFTKMESERKARAPAVSAKRWRPLVYICSPYSDDILNNERKARVFCKFAVREGAIPIAPHLLYPQFLDENNPRDRELGLFFGLVMLTKCEQVWVFGSRVSSGMSKEICKAESKSIPIRYFNEDCQEVNGIES
jgi:hypothetical protein